jgi:RNA polymerase sigma-B factor
MPGTMRQTFTGPTARSAEQVQELFELWSAHRDPAARDALITHHIPLARRLAARYRSAHDGNEDLVQVAMIGLIGAVDRFDPERATSFASFAIPTILGEIKRHFRNTGWAAHVPRRAQELSLRVAQASRELTTQSGRTPTVHDLAQYLELDLETVIEGLEAGGAHHATSLDAPVGRAADGDESEPLAETIGEDDERLRLAETRISLGAAIRRLPPREREALSLRVNDELLQVEIAERLGCSQMQVSRLLRRAAGRLRDDGVISA